MINQNKIQMRNRTVEFYRGIATLLVVVYHVWVYSQYPDTGYNVIVGYGGEIGVTLFFIISGFSIFMNIENKSNGEIRYKEFIKERFIKLAVGYYICMFILILFNSSNYYLLESGTGLKNILAHIFFLHNLFPSTHGSINGVFWTLGTIMQFYLIAPLLYRCIKKAPYMSFIISIIVVIGYKYIAFNMLKSDVNNIYYFIYGRQLMGSLDNFVSGMFIGHWWDNECKNKESYTPGKGKSIIIIIITSIVAYILLKLLNSNSLYSNTTFAYTWHTGLAVVLAIQIIGAIKLRLELNNKVSKMILYISKVEYSIYLWHLPIIICLTSLGLVDRYSSIKAFYIVTVLTLVLSVVWSEIYLSMIKEITNKKNWNRILKKLNLYNVLLGILIGITAINTPNYSGYIKEIVNGSKNYLDGNIIRHDSLGQLVEYIQDNIELSNKTTYVYIDNNDYEGTMNFWAMRYYLSPMKAIHWNSYAYNLDISNEAEVYNYLNAIDVEYIVVKQCPAIFNAFNLEYRDKGYIFRKNQGIHLELDTLLSRVGEDI